MDRMGRRAVLLIGIATGCIALTIMDWAVVMTRLELFWLGLLVFGFGSGIIQQSRIAVMDMYPVERRGEGMGYLMTANIVGSFLSPVFTEAMIPVADFLALDVYAVILLVGTILLASASIFILRLKPDTKEIATNLSSYYSDSVANNMVIGLSSLSLPVFGGLVISGLGLVAFGLSGLLIAVPTLLVMLPLREVRPGKYSTAD